MRIIDEALFAKVEARPRPTEPRFPKPQARNIRFVLSGLCQCECGRTLVLIGTQTGRRHLGCTGGAGDDSHSGRRRYSLSVLESAVVGGLAEFLDTTANEWRFLERLRSSIAERQDQIASDRRILDSEIERLDRTIEEAVAQSFTDPRLAERRESYLARQLDQLDELRRRRQLMIVPQMPVAPDDAVATLRGSLAMLKERVPFLPPTPPEWAVHGWLRRMVRKVVVRRLEGREIEIEVEYDLGSAVGDGSGAGIVTRSIRVKSSEITRESSPHMRKRVSDALASGEYQPNDELFELAKGDPDFSSLFGSYTEDIQRSVLHLILLRLLLVAPSDLVLKAVPDLDVQLKGAILEFRRTKGVLRLARWAMAFYPGRDIVPSAVRPHPIRLRKTGKHLKASEHPFLQLDMCRSDGRTEVIPPDHVRLASDVLATLVPSRGKLTRYVRSIDDVVRLLEASAYCLRMKVSFLEGASRYGIDYLRLGQWFAVLERYGKLRPVAERLLELQRGDRIRVGGADALPSPTD